MSVSVLCQTSTLCFMASQRGYSEKRQLWRSYHQTVINLAIQGDSIACQHGDMCICICGHIQYSFLLMCMGMGMHANVRVLIRNSNDNQGHTCHTHTQPENSQPCNNWWAVTEEDHFKMPHFIISHPNTYQCHQALILKVLQQTTTTNIPSELLICGQCPWGKHIIPSALPETPSPTRQGLPVTKQKPGMMFIFLEVCT